MVCGHIHHAQIRTIDGILYCNDGDWVESLTALVEHHDGQLEIIDRGYQAALPGMRIATAPAPSPSPAAVPLPVPAAVRDTLS